MSRFPVYSTIKKLTTRRFLQRLLMAAGQDLEPYWEVYRQHFRGHVVAWMEVSAYIAMFPCFLS
jgi:hypothetical protein